MYNTGLFVLDLDMAPFGCGPWLILLMHAFSDLFYRCMACVLVFNKVFLINYPPDIVLLLGPWEMALGHTYVGWPS